MKQPIQRTHPEIAREPGLRERKKLAAMRQIQAVALDLFEQNGYENVTIEQIAAASDVSPSSVYRYFGDKEHLVIWDEMDLRLLEVIEDELQSHPPIEACRHAVVRVFSNLYSNEEEMARRKTLLYFEEPALRTIQFELLEVYTVEIAEALARATGREAGDLQVQVVASALVGTLMMAIQHWHAGGYKTHLQDEIDEALDAIENGLTLPVKSA